jgi:hypothetical protein
LRNPDRQIEAYRQAIGVEPRSALARHGLAVALAASGKLDLAIVEYRKLAADYLEVRPDFARLLLIQNLRLPPAGRDWAEVERALDAIASDKQSTAEVRLLRAEVLAAQDKTDEARKLAEMKGIRPRRSVLAAPCRARGQKGDTKAAPGVLDGRAESRTTRGWPLARGCGLRTAPTGEERASQTAGRPRRVRAEVEPAAGRTAEAFVATDDLPTARRLWQRLSSVSPQPGRAVRAVRGGLAAKRRRKPSGCSAR